MGLKLTSNSTDGVNTVKAENIVIRDNLFVAGEIGVSAGGNTTYWNGYRWKNMTIKDNVFLHTGAENPTGRGVAWGLEVWDWDTGVVSNNYFLFNDANMSNTQGVKVVGYGRDVKIKENVFSHLDTSAKAARMISMDNENNKAGIDIAANAITMKGSELPSLRKDLNTYFLLGMGNNGISTLVEEAKNQSKDSWAPKYTARKINEYLRGN